MTFTPEYFTIPEVQSIQLCVFPDLGQEDCILRPRNIREIFRGLKS